MFASLSEIQTVERRNGILLGGSGHGKAGAPLGTTAGGTLLAATDKLDAIVSGLPDPASHHYSQAPKK